MTTTPIDYLIKQSHLATVAAQEGDEKATFEALQNMVFGPSEPDSELKLPVQKDETQKSKSKRMRHKIHDDSDTEDEDSDTEDEDDTVLRSNCMQSRKPKSKRMRIVNDDSDTEDEDDTVLWSKCMHPQKPKSKRTRHGDDEKVMGPFVNQIKEDKREENEVIDLTLSDSDSDSDSDTVSDIGE